MTSEELKRWHRKHTRHKQRLHEQRQEELRAAQRQSLEASTPPVPEGSARAESAAHSEGQLQGVGGAMGVDSSGSPPRFLAAMVFNRVYDEDGFHMTSFQLMQVRPPHSSQ